MGIKKWSDKFGYVEVGYRSNVFAPLLWFNAIVDSILITGICIINNDSTIRCFFSILVALVTTVTLVIYLVLLMKDPKLLQSEKFQQ